MHDQQISNQRRTHTVRFLCCFAVTIANNIEACAYLSSAIFLTSLSWRQKWRVSWFNDFIGRFSQETKPRPQKLANIIDDRLTPALERKDAHHRLLIYASTRESMGSPTSGKFQCDRHLRSDVPVKDQALCPYQDTTFYPQNLKICIMVCHAYENLKAV